MNWEQLGAIGEIVSGIAVLATLLYLAIQIRQAKNLMLSSAHQNRTDRNIALMHFIANDEQSLNRTLGNLTPEEMSDVELLRATYLFSTVLRHFEDMQYQHQLGIVDSETWGANMEGIRSSLTSNGGIVYWQGCKHMFRPSFAELVDKIIQEDT